VSAAVVAYVPVLHEGYWRFFQAHAPQATSAYLIGPELYEDYRPLAKDVRALDAQLVARALDAWNVFEHVEVLTAERATALAEARTGIVMPDEDVSHQVADRYFVERCEVRFDTVFLRWDRGRTLRLERPRTRTVPVETAIADLQGAAEIAAAQSIDWWRQVGAAIRLADGELRFAANVHDPHPLTHYVSGDPRSNLFKGVGYELSTATHAEARLIAEAARAGRSTEGAVMYVTDFPCPPCARLIAAAGVSRLYFRDGYAVLDGEEILRAAGVDILQSA